MFNLNTYLSKRFLKFHSKVYTFIFLNGLDKTIQLFTIVVLINDKKKKEILQCSLKLSTPVALLIILHCTGKPTKVNWFVCKLWWLTKDKLGNHFTVSLHHLFQISLVHLGVCLQPVYHLTAHFCCPVLHLFRDVAAFWDLICYFTVQYYRNW